MIGEIGRIVKLFIIVFMLMGCTSTSIKDDRYGHWIFRGSSTFQQVFQCVDKLEPHQDKEC